MSSYDWNGLYDFLAHTPEQGLRKMLVDGKPMTDSHFSLLLKVVRAGSPEFCKCAQEKSFPKVKFSPGETKLKDKFWDDCYATFNARGILGPATGAKAA